jgi:Endosomal/lysosomal potassium channel TMEM175
MDTGGEPLSTDGSYPVEQQTDARASVLPQTDKVPTVSQTAASARRTQRITGRLEGIRPTPGSNVTRIYGISDCVIAVAFTLFVVNMHQPPAGLSEAQLQSFLKQDILPDILFYLGTYLVVASS